VTREIFSPIRWDGDVLLLLDQTVLPAREEWLRCRRPEDVADAIRRLAVRGAPAIGVAAAFGLVLAIDPAEPDGDAAARAATEAGRLLLSTRPTAVNLRWALDRGAEVIDRARSRVARSSDARGGAAGAELRAALLEWAQELRRQDIEANLRIGEHGKTLFAKQSRVLTHCNTGSLATAGFGTALGVIRAGVGSGQISRVFAGETRPWLQGARLTMWELLRDAIPATLVADSAAAHLMASGAVQWVIVGADRIAANGDTANKIGTYQLAISARHHGVKFMVVAPSSTVDLSTRTGAEIEIELRSPDELFAYGGQRTVVDGAQAWNPVFDVTPGSLIDALVTERGVVEHPDAQRMGALFGGVR
jgi:methylthioribose-1-phosphate isomerase